MRKRASSNPSVAVWYASYGDLVTNMLCFFVMLFAFATLDSTPEKKETSQPMDQIYYAIFSINQAQGAHQWLTKGHKSILSTPSGRKQETVHIVKHVKNKLHKVPMHDRIKVTTENQTVKIQIPANVLFESGNATMKKGAEEVLTALTPIIGTIDNYIRVDGYTDDLPPNARSQYPSNWELSAARACAVVRFFINDMSLEKDRFSAQGYGDCRPKVSNETEEGRKINRRVEINILSQRKKSDRSENWY